LGVRWRGWFFDAWDGDGAYQKSKITANECPRITAEFLAEEEKALGERWFRQEYLCSFEDAIGALFSAEDIARAFDCDETPFFTT
jgi:hypothetical protein